jgi:hypothetical protein
MCVCVLEFLCVINVVLYVLQRLLAATGVDPVIEDMPSLSDNSAGAVIQVMLKTMCNVAGDCVCT